MNSIRIDRLLTLYSISPLRKILKFSKKQIPVLMYHSISNDTTEEGHPYFWVNTSPDTFAQHMRYLKENNYKVVDLDQAFSSGEQMDDNHKYVVITFDDGFYDFYSNAFPILSESGLSATVFLPTAFINSSFKSRKCLSWKDVRELCSLGIKFGSHTVNHPQLKNLSREKIESELCLSKEMIEDNIGHQINSFCYPFAFPEEDKEFIAFLKHLMQKYNYKYFLTTMIGTSKYTTTDFIKRIPVNTADDIKFFRAKLTGAYDWVHILQYYFKYLKNLYYRKN